MCKLIKRKKILKNHFAVNLTKPKNEENFAIKIFCKEENRFLYEKVEWNQLIED